MAQQERTIQIGNNTIVVHSHEFSHGYTYGFLAYSDTRTRLEFPLSDRAVGRHLVEMVETPTHIEWIAGYLVGWVEALLEGSDETFTSVLYEEGQP